MSLMNFTINQSFATTTGELVTVENCLSYTNSLRNEIVILYIIISLLIIIAYIYYKRSVKNNGKR